MRNFAFIVLLLLFNFESNQTLPFALADFSIECNDGSENSEEENQNKEFLRLLSTDYHLNYELINHNYSEGLSLNAQNLSHSIITPPPEFEYIRIV